jgi:hypothetical protein
MASPVRLGLQGEDYAQHWQDLAAFVTVYQGAAAQNQFRITFTAFPQESVPAASG